MGTRSAPGMGRGSAAEAAPAVAGFPWCSSATALLWVWQEKNHFGSLTPSSSQAFSPLLPQTLYKNTVTALLAILGVQAVRGTRSSAEHILQVSVAQPGPQPQSITNSWVLSIYTIHHFLELTQGHLQHEITEFSEASQQSHCTMTELVSAREQPQPVLGICTQQALQAQCALPGTPPSALLFNLG